MRITLATLCLVAVARTLGAQCPDGTPPPCAGERAPVRATPAAPDPNRIAILPFRVTGADSVLSEGIAELLAAEFTGSRGPRAVHMGTVIRAWRQAGGSAREPLTQPSAVRTARQVGAGLFVDGSIVGLGTRLTVTASVYSLDGQARRAEPIRGSGDSLDALISRLTTTLLGLAGAESREGARGVLTGSPAAMRAYLEGMAAWRAYRVADANSAFERAFREDSTFARAALMRYWTANWFAEEVTQQWGRTVFGMRQRLSSADRMLLNAMLGEQYPTPRLRQVMVSDRERAAALLPESPEAQYLAGDVLFHYGGAVDAPDALERARRYFEKSLAMDTQLTVLSHLADVTTLLGDTALLRRLQPALEPRARELPRGNWIVAGYLGDQAWLGRLRLLGDVNGEAGGSLAAMALSPAAIADEAVERVPAPGPFGADNEPIRSRVADAQGRPVAARQARAGHPPSVLLAIVGAMAGERDEAEAVAAVRHADGRTGLTPAQVALRDCEVALWHAWTGDVAAERPLTDSDATRNCYAMVELLRAWRARASDLAERLQAADSLVRGRLSFTTFRGYENIVLARLWESQGDKRRAASAIRLYVVGGDVGVGFRLREEGRLAAETGQVDRAIEAYRLYLELRKDAEPVFHAERDSVRAALRRLVRQ